jgi:hypothetical protein
MTPQAILEQLHALVILAWSLLRSIFGRKLGLADFREHYAPDRLPPVGIAERRRLPTFGGCIACGLCDVGQGDLTQASRGAYAGTMDLMLASSRSMPDYDAATASFNAIGDARLAELEKICPARVPMREIAAFVRAKGAEITDAPILKA